MFVQRLFFLQMGLHYKPLMHNKYAAPRVLWVYEGKKKKNPTKISAGPSMKVDWVQPFNTKYVSWQYRLSSLHDFLLA